MRKDIKVMFVLAILTVVANSAHAGISFSCYLQALTYNNAGPVSNGSIPLKTRLLVGFQRVIARQMRPHKAWAWAKRVRQATRFLRSMQHHHGKFKTVALFYMVTYQ